MHKYLFFIYKYRIHVLLVVSWNWLLHYVVSKSCIMYMLETIDSEYEGIELHL